MRSWISRSLDFLANSSWTESLASWTRVCFSRLKSCSVCWGVAFGELFVVLEVRERGGGRVRSGVGWICELINEWQSQQQQQGKVL